MYFDSWSALFSMDGHGVYVWSAYLISLSVLALLVWWPLSRNKRFLSRLARRQKLTSQGNQQAVRSGVSD